MAQKKQFKISNFLHCGKKIMVRIFFIIKTQVLKKLTTERSHLLKTDQELLISKREFDFNEMKQGKLRYKLKLLEVLKNSCGSGIKAIYFLNNSINRIFLCYKKQQNIKY